MRKFIEREEEKLEKNLIGEIFMRKKGQPMYATDIKGTFHSEDFVISIMLVRSLGLQCLCLRLGSF